jgi:predicted ArsR family transcriptional regulator
MKRKPYEVRQKILMLLKEKPLSYTQLQTKLSTNYDSIKNNCEELKMYEFIDVKTIENHPENGQPSHKVELTQKGAQIVKKLEEKST